MNKNKKLHFITRVIVGFVIFMSLDQLLQTSIITVNATLSGTDALYQGHIYEDKTKHPNAKLPYRIYIPVNYDKNKSYPLVIHLCGAAELGINNENQLHPNTMTRLLLEEENPQKYPCIIVAPQCTLNDNWVQNFYGKISTSLDMTVGLINQLRNKYNIDINRLYVTGYSSGGTGTWDLIYRYPQMFAAAIPIGSIAAPNYAKKIKGVPIWVFHADGDTAVPVSQARNMVSALKNAGSTVVKYTEYNSTEHGAAWVWSYKEQGLLPWLFAQKISNVENNSRVGSYVDTTSSKSNSGTTTSSIKDNETFKSSSIEKNRSLPTSIVRNETTLIFSIVLLAVLLIVVFIILVIIYKKKMIDKK